MRRFKWIEWNLQKVAAHGLSAPDVEAAFDKVYELKKRQDESYEMYAETPAARRIWVIWRYDRETAFGDILSDLDELPIFVITAY